MARRPKQFQTSASSPPTEPAAVHAPRALDAPVFAQPEPTADPSIFKIKHPSDDAAYKVIDQLNKEHKIQPMPFPPPRGDGAEPQLTLGPGVRRRRGADRRHIADGQIVFHATGDCGSTRGPKTRTRSPTR